MTLITPDEGPRELSDAVASLKRQLCEMRTDLEDLHTKLRTDSREDVSKYGRLITDIKQWLKFAIETEVKLEQREKKEKGIVNGYALDIDAARHSIGCRLDRLRRAKCPKGFPR
ncbi:hypothetical protein G5B38_13135 [Pseudohalocynthiibacter aestuariivivens]|uniref:Uncharacterized protein n=1 Tax=Roseovarius pelagicus TaxID=2980108 RepID=A0ABY6D7Q0_9RHOB|nr:hypothetical protein [Roseovarius pelagicus]QIE46389.1 hypothetical protein G5B38_13135 [Pseudohalocynthiibacter aestuariivivens]UXX81630.1 hypothetical protein N7U68_10815 [Roseovarius pelagicus]